MKAIIADLIIVDPNQEEKEKAGSILSITRGSKKGDIYSTDFIGALTNDELDKVII